MPILMTLTKRMTHLPVLYAHMNVLVQTWQRTGQVVEDDLCCGMEGPRNKLTIGVPSIKWLAGTALLPGNGLFGGGELRV